MSEPSKFAAALPFKASFVKIARARHHIKELETLAAAYLEGDPVKFSVTLGPFEDGRSGIEFAGHIAGAPDEISAVIGDIIHNLRAALDLMACELCRLKQQSDKGVHFPFCDEESGLEGAIERWHFDRAGPEAVRLLTELKPYKGGDIALRTLHDLDIHDKHRQLIPSSVSYCTPIFELLDKDGNIHTDAHGNFVPRLVSEDVSDVQLVFPPDCGLTGRELIPTLHQLVELTASIVERFKALSSPAG